MRSRLDKCKRLWCAKLSINFKKIIMRKFLILLFLFPLLLTSCGGRGSAKGEGNATAGEVDSLLYARNLSLERFIIGSNSSNNSDSSEKSAGFRPGSRHTSLLNRADFPTFGLPTMATIGFGII